MRSAMAMIELIFAIVVIAISLLSIPSMMAVAAQSSKGSVIDEDVMSRLSGWVLDKFQARWDANYQGSGSGPLWIVGDLNCTSRGSGNVWYRVNPDSTMQCDGLNRAPSAIPSPGSGNLSNGIEQLNGGSENLVITATTGENYTITANYAVSYVPSTVSVSGNTATATWVLGSSTAMEPSPSVTATHLKRVVTRFSDPDTQTDMVLTFFKSNKGN